MRAELAWLTFWATVIVAMAIFAVIAYQDAQAYVANLPL